MSHLKKMQDHWLCGQGKHDVSEIGYSNEYHYEYKMCYRCNKVLWSKPCECKGNILECLTAIWDIDLSRNRYLSMSAYDVNPNDFPTVKFAENWDHFGHRIT